MILTTTEVHTINLIFFKHLRFWEPFLNINVDLLERFFINNNWIGMTVQRLINGIAISGDIFSDSDVYIDEIRSLRNTLISLGKMHIVSSNVNSYLKFENSTITVDSRNRISSIKVKISDYNLNVSNILYDGHSTNIVHYKEETIFFCRTNYTYYPIDNPKYDKIEVWIFHTIRDMITINKYKNNIIQESVSHNLIESFDSKGNQIRVINIGDGSYRDMNVMKEYEYCKYHPDNILKITETYEDGSVNFVEFTYDEKGNCTKRCRNGLDSGYNFTYSYNDKNELFCVSLTSYINKSKPFLFYIPS